MQVFNNFTELKAHADIVYGTENYRPSVITNNAFQITVPKLASKTKPDLSTHEYGTREAAEKDAAAWRNARIEKKKDQFGKNVYILVANGQRFITTHWQEAVTALEQAQASHVTETP